MVMSVQGPPPKTTLDRTWTKGTEHPSRTYREIIIHYRKIHVRTGNRTRGPLIIRQRHYHRHEAERNFACVNALAWNKVIASAISLIFVTVLSKVILHLTYAVRSRRLISCEDNILRLEDIKKAIKGLTEKLPGKRAIGRSMLSWGAYINYVTR